MTGAKRIIIYIAEFVYISGFILANHGKIYKKSGEFIWNA